MIKTALALLLIALLWGVNAILPEYSRTADSLMGYTQSWNNSALDTAGMDLNYNKADYDAQSIKAAEQALDEQLAGEGYVLLKNGVQTMPFPQGTAFSFFSEASKTLSSS